MNIDIKNIISNGETEKSEFKSSFNKEVIETLVAFANTKGGSVYIGISEKGKIIGVDINIESVQIWINEIKTKTTPALIVDSEAVEIDNKNIVVFTIQEYPIKPVATQSKYYQRRKNSNHLLSVSEISDLYLQNMQLSWDSYFYPSVSINNLSKKKIEVFINKVNNIGRFRLDKNEILALEKLGFIKENRLTNASVILFSNNLQDYKIHIGRFKSPTYIVSDKLISGTLFDALEESMQTIISHIKFAFEITGKTTQRIEIPEYPLKAIREILINSIVPRDYKSPVDIQIKIFDQKITFFNPGNLYGNLTIEDLKTDKYQSRARNKLISEAFYLTGDIEKYGSGYQRIRDEIAEYPTMKFEFEEIGNGFLVELSYKKQKTMTNEPLNEALNDTINEPLNELLNERQIQIIDIIKKNKSITIPEIAEITNTGRATIKRDIDKLKELKIIERFGSRKAGYWNIIRIDNTLNDPINEPLNEPINDRKIQIIEIIKNNKTIKIAEIAEKTNTGRETIKRDIDKLKQLKIIERVGSRKAGYWMVRNMNNEL